MYAGLGAGIFALRWLAGAGDERREEMVREHVAIEPDLEDAIDQALARGPVVFAASHTGNWEIAAHAAARLMRARGKGLSVVVKPMSVGHVNAFCTRLRARLEIGLLSPHGALAGAKAALARGDAVAMMIDQVPDHARHGEPVPFLGQNALCDRAPSALARAAGATLIVVGAHREGSRHRVVRLAVLDPVGSSTVALTRRATSALERFVRQRPEEWMWLHRRWRAPALSSRSIPANHGPWLTTWPSKTPSSSPVGASRAA